MNNAKKQFEQQGYDNFTLFGLIEEMLTPLGFHDSSWHNDTAPSLSGGSFQVFVDFQDPECVGDNQIVINYFDDDLDEWQEVCQTNDLLEVFQQLKCGSTAA